LLDQRDIGADVPRTKHLGDAVEARIDGREAWQVTIAALVIASVALGAPYIVAVALKPIAEDLGGLRSVPSGASSLALLGTGVGGLVMGWVAERVGVRFTAIFGGLMVFAGLALSAGGEVWQLYVGHGLLIGFLGNGAINAPLYVYVTRWFERRRGTALALIASGQYVAGALWPPMFERAMATYGWRMTMLGYGALVAAVVLPLALVFLKPAPAAPQAATSGTDGAQGSGLVLGLRPNVTFISRQFWGWLSDRIGGLMTLIIGSGAQAAATAGFIFTQDEAGLFAVAAAFGLGFAGLIPAYILTARKYFPASEASWRVPTILLTGMSGMAAGSWLAGVIYDYFGFYAPAFATGLAFNLINFAVIALLLVQARRARAL
jgi:MFS family permease